jgi:TolB-like protein
LAVREVWITNASLKVVMLKSSILVSSSDEASHGVERLSMNGDARYSVAGSTAPDGDRIRSASTAHCQHRHR